MSIKCQFGDCNGMASEWNICNFHIEQAVELFLSRHLPKQLHSTEQKYPEQCQFFRDTIEEMYTVMLKKNMDYSPYNIKVTGLRGLVTRLWDKSARFFSLMGLDIGTGEWAEPREPENESIDQNLIDWANYCIIARIFMAGKWAR